MPGINVNNPDSDLNIGKLRIVKRIGQTENLILQLIRAVVEGDISWYWQFYELLRIYVKLSLLYEYIIKFAETGIFASNQ